MYRQTVAIIDLDAIRSNFLLARRLAPKSRNVAVIKADAYGHGAIEVARALQSEADAFAVATVEEAVELREAGIANPVLLLEGVFDEAAVRAAANYNLWVMLHSQEQVEILLSTDTEAKLTVWIKVDTGMHRLGIGPAELSPVLQQLRSANSVADDRVICTHLASANDRSDEMTCEQSTSFRSGVSEFHMPLSISNSAGILAWPETHADWNRPGYMLYGNSPFSHSCPNADQLKPAMTLSAELIAIRTVDSGESVGYGGHWTATRRSTIGTVAIGYADGYPVSACNGTPTLINGRMAPLVGAVSMDMISIDLTGHSTVSVGDSVVLWGEDLSVNDIAARANSIGYALLAGLSPRVPRRYVGSDQTAREPRDSR